MLVCVGVCDALQVTLLMRFQLISNNNFIKPAPLKIISKKCEKEEQCGEGGKECKLEFSKECRGGVREGAREGESAEIHNSFVLIKAQHTHTHTQRETKTVDANLHSMSNASVAALLPLPTHRFVLSFVLFVLAQQVGGAALCLSACLCVCVSGSKHTAYGVCVCVCAGLGKSEIAND